MIELGGVLIVALIVYGITVVLAHQYGKDWVVPEGTESANWAMRHDLGVALGAAAVAISAITCYLFIPNWLGRVITLAQTIVLAAAGASDVRKFHLPLPLTFAGILLSIVALTLRHTPLFVVMFGLIWAAALIGLHAALSKGTMQLGDHIATLWIALAIPFNGMLAVILGDFANVGVARAKSLKGKKVAAAGAWLIFAAALVGAPSYYELVRNFTKPAALNTVEPIAQDEATKDAAATSSNADMPAPQAAVVLDPNVRALSDVLTLARYETGRLAMIDQRAERIKQARRASTKLARLASIAAQRGGSHELVYTLQQLSQSLAAYDVEGVQTASAALAAAQDELLTRVSQASVVSNQASDREASEVNTANEATETDSMNTDTTSKTIQKETTE